MPPTVTLTPDVLRRGDRTANIHPESWDPTVVQYGPLGEYPLMRKLDGLISMEEAIGDVIHHYFEKPFNSQTGTISDTYTTADVVGGTAVSGTQVSGFECFVKPDATGFTKLLNITPNTQIEIYSTSVRKSVRGYTTSVHVGTSTTSYFNFILTEDDGSSVLAGTGLSWTVLADGQSEVHELGSAVNEHETEYYNYAGMLEVAHQISEREWNTDSRVNEDKKKMRETDSLNRLYQKREMQALEGTRLKIGDRYWAGGLRFYLNAYESANIIDWRTDTTYSASTDTPLGGTIDFIKNLSVKLRENSKVGARKVLLMSAYMRNFLDQCVVNSGVYQIGYETDRYGVNVAVLRGLDQELEIMEEPLFNTNDAKKYSIYFIEPSLIKRRPTKTGALKQLAWSSFDDASRRHATYIEGGWRVEETYQWNRPGAHAIIENLSLAKT